MAASSLQPARPTTLRLAFAPDAASARAVAEAIRAFLTEQGVPEKELFSYELCVAEASNNAIKYAVGPARDLKPVAEALFTPDQIELRMTDHTPGFVLPERVPQPSPLKDCGRGLFIIQSVMDEVRYMRGTKENILIMRKRRRAHQPPATERPGASASGLSPEESQRQLADSKRDRANLAAELAFRSETLSAIFRCCAELGRSDGVAEGFGKRLLVDLFHLTTADCCVLRLVSPDQRKLVVAAASETELAFDPIALPLAGEPPRGIEATVAARLTAARFDLREDADRSEPLRAIGPEATGLVCPLVFGGMLVGSIAVGRRGGDFPLGKLQDEVVRVFAEFLAIQTVNLRRHKEEVLRRLVVRESEIAQEIQHLLLPRTLPQLEGFGLAGGWQSARAVGGDFYDALAVGEQSLFLMVADVMGKGVPAALFAATMRGLLRGLAARSDDPAKILGGLNRLLYAELSAVNMFITAQVVHVDLATRQITAASAGHCPPLYVPADRHTVVALPVHGLPIGVLPGTVYQSATARLGTPATLLIHTDGLTDTRNTDGRQFGQRRLMGWLSANAVAGHSAAELRDRLATELNRFRGDADMDDDQAFLLLAEAHVNADRSTAPRLQFQRGSFLFPACT
ncbi:MAG: SpoIIE family protein phosphatase [Verrucomicrobia bacterium]|nr:SpoIIE family protein phosphatase [Verrucomicrobiota bacterium]